MNNLDFKYMYMFRLKGGLKALYYNLTILKKSTFESFYHMIWTFFFSNG